MLVAFKENLKSIYAENESYFQSVSYKDKIDFSKTKKTWGSELIPNELKIDITKNYETYSGLEVKIFEIKVYTELGNEYTFPVKGAYLVKKPNKKDQWTYCVWTLDGRMNIFEKDLENPLNLKEKRS